MFLENVRASCFLFVFRIYMLFLGQNVSAQHRRIVIEELFLYWLSIKRLMEVRNRV